MISPVTAYAPKSLVAFLLPNESFGHFPPVVASVLVTCDRLVLLLTGTSPEFTHDVRYAQAQAGALSFHS